MKKPTLARLRALSIKVQDGRYPALRTKEGYGSYNQKLSKQQQIQRLLEWRQRIIELEANVAQRIYALTREGV